MGGDVERLVKAAVNDIVEGRPIPAPVADELKKHGITPSMILERIHERVVGGTPREFIDTVGQKTALLCNLIWDMIDSLIDYCALHNVSEVKSVSRTLRELKREYDRFRAPAIDDEKRRIEDENAEIFRELYKDDFSSILNSMLLDTSGLRLSDEQAIFINAVHRTIAMGKTLKLYGAWADSELLKYGGMAAKYSFIQNSMLKALELVPLYAGDCHLRNIGSCDIAARLIYRRIREVKIASPLTEEAS